MAELAAESRPAWGVRLTFVCYVLFAVVAGLCNLASQEATVWLYPALPLMVYAPVGSSVRFVEKCVLDKRWILFDD